MAVAGKAAITLDGAWSSTKDYDRLTGVVHNNSLFISRKKPPIGTAPSEGEYWMLCIEGVNEQDLDALAARVLVVENNYFPKTGGQLEGELKVRNANNGFGRLFKNNSASADYGVNLVDYAGSNKNITLILSALNDLFQYKDSAGNFHDILHAGNVGEYAFPATGGNISGNKLGLIDGKACLLGSPDDIELVAYEEGLNEYSALGVSKIVGYELNDVLKLYQRKNGVLNRYKIFGEHSKPFGSYTGTGSASERTINTYGIGRLLLVYKEGSDVFALVSPQGALVKNLGEADGTQAGSAYFVNGYFYIATTSAYFNQSGATYYYQVI